MKNASFIIELKSRNEPLFYFGLTCMVLSILFLILTTITTLELSGTNIWFKPFKFAFSIAMYSLTMGWLVYYLPSFNTGFFNWSVISLLGFEIFYIAIQAGRGQRSHFNLSTPFYATLYMCMAVAATLVTVYTAYIGIKFFRTDFSNLPLHYVWSIRIGIIVFVIFSLEGFVMGSRLSHTIGGEDGSAGLPLVNWSTKYGDPRIAHFIGMHALQVLPLLSFYLLKNVKSTMMVGMFYGLLALFSLIQALSGKPFHKF